MGTASACPERSALDIPTTDSPAPLLDSRTFAHYVNLNVRTGLWFENSPDKSFFSFLFFFFPPISNVYLTWAVFLAALWGVLFQEPPPVLEMWPSLTGGSWSDSPP